MCPSVEIFADVRSLSFESRILRWNEQHCIPVSVRLLFHVEKRGGFVHAGPAHCGENLHS